MSTKTRTGGGLGRPGHKRLTAGRKARLEALESRLVLSTVAARLDPVDAHAAVARPLVPPVVAAARPVAQAVSVDSSTSNLVVRAAVTITQIPKFNQAGNLHGVVTGVNPSKYRVAAYIQVEGAGWWNKPTDAIRTAGIHPDGKFSVNVVTGGLDAQATVYCVMVVPVGHTPPLAHGAASAPADSLAKAVAYKERYTGGTKVWFAGRTWAVKEAPLAAGPGGNLFSARSQDVWVDARGLHLGIHRHNGRWWSSEVILPQKLGYGTYAFVTNSRLDALDPNAVFGGFTWDPYGGDPTFPTWPNREADIEVSRFGNASDTKNAQFVLQPYNLAGHRERFTLPDLSANANVTWLMRWTPDSIEYTAVRGNYPSGKYPRSAVIHQWTYRGAVPRPGRAMFHFNLWLNAPAPARGRAVDIVVRDFRFTP